MTKSVTGKQPDTFGEALHKLFSGFATFVEQLKQIDWQKVLAAFNAAIRQEIQDARTLAERGWTIAGWMTRTQVQIALRLDDDELLDQYFTMTYCENEFHVLNGSFARLNQSPGMTTWRPLLEEVRVNLVEGRHLIAIPALLTVLEGFAVKQILKPSGTTKKTTNLATKFAEMGRHQSDSIEAVPWASNLAFMEKLFANSDFDGDAPKLLNRHWVLHGRTECNWRLADALRLVNALEMLRWLEEMETESRGRKDAE